MPKSIEIKHLKLKIKYYYKVVVTVMLQKVQL
jgi:hypothetical protein